MDTKKIIRIAKLNVFDFVERQPHRDLHLCDIMQYFVMSKKFISYRQNVLWLELKVANSIFCTLSVAQSREENEVAKVFCIRTLDIDRL